MIENINKIVPFLFFVLINTIVKAQQPAIEMATGMRQSGKIYVVVGVLVIIFAGITAFLIHLDRKISKLEKENTSDGNDRNVITNVNVKITNK